MNASRSCTYGRITQPSKLRRLYDAPSRTFVSLRASENAQREIRRYAEAVERLFAEQMPITYEAFLANNRTAP